MEGCGGEISQTEKDQYCIISLIKNVWNLKIYIYTYNKLVNLTKRRLADKETKLVIKGREAR